MSIASEAESQQVRCADASTVRLVRMFIDALRDDARIQIVVELVRVGPLSARALSRRLRMNYKRLNKALRDLEVVGLVEAVKVNVSESRAYRFYNIKPNVKIVLEMVLRSC
ncbi:MAG: hypothetical protein GXO32_00020 [Crenarchaeota archaeon]|nr:hypothetical protein [Thermoproteota archaeon]